MKFLAFHSNQLDDNGSQGANGAGSAGRIQSQGHEVHGRLVHDLCTDTINHKTIYSSIKRMFFFHACNKSDHLQLRPDAAIMLQVLRCLGNVTSWNIHLHDLGCTSITTTNH